MGGAEGMLVTEGGRFGGYGFYLLKGKPVFLWNLVDLKRVRWEAPEALSPGKHTLALRLPLRRRRLGQPGLRDKRHRPGRPGRVESGR